MADDSSEARNGRPKIGYTSSLRTAGKRDLKKLELAAVQAIIGDQKYITLAVSYLMVFPDDFPRATIEKRVGLVDYRRVNARQLLTWLNKKGYSSITLEDLRVAKMKFTKGEYGVGEI